MRRKKPFPVQTIRTPSGDEMVILPKRDYDALVAMTTGVPVLRSRPVEGDPPGAFVIGGLATKRPKNKPRKTRAIR